MLQNRVDPQGNIIKTEARGHWTGNRGVLHDANKTIVRSFKLKAWITCRLEFKGSKRPIMAPNRWTELFFLDEATAFAAGHRPCFECRREDADRFKSFWLQGNPEYGFHKKTSIAQIDEILHIERIGRDKEKIGRDKEKIGRDKEKIGRDHAKHIFEEDPRRLPDGTFVRIDQQPLLILNRQLYPWSPSGYGQPTAFPNTEKVAVLTPRSIVNTLRAGYAPQMAIRPI